VAVAVLAELWRFEKKKEKKCVGKCPVKKNVWAWQW
jgi:hypothetical protein